VEFGSAAGDPKTKICFDRKAEKSLGPEPIKSSVIEAPLSVGPSTIFSLEKANKNVRHWFDGIDVLGADYRSADLASYALK
jgi:hypothetical protein